MVKKILVIIGILFVLFILGSILLTSLGGARNKISYPAPSTGLSNPLASEGIVSKNNSDQTGVNSSETPSRLVIKTGIINMVVKDIRFSVNSIVQYAGDKGGWIVNSSLIEQKEVPSGSVVIRVPAEIFDEAMAYFRGLAEKVTHESTQGQDVTEEYVDLQSRLRNLEATENQLLKIMERSGNITEILSVQRELTNTREQIERIKGQIQYLEQNAKMATITVNLALSEDLLPIPPSEKWRPVYVLKQAWRSVLISLRGISYFLIWILIYSIVWLPLTVIIWQGRKIWQRRKMKV